MNGLYINRLAAGVWLLLVAVLLFSAWRQGPVVDTSVMALLPADEQQPNIKRATDHQADAYANSLLLVIRGQTAAEAAEGTRYAAERLAALADLVNLTWQAQGAEALVQDLYPYRFTVLSEAVRERLQQEGGSAQYQLALQRLFNPVSGFSQQPLEDPFSLFVDLAMAQQSNLPVGTDQGLLRLTASDMPAYLVRLELLDDPFNLSVQARVNAVLNPLLDELQQRGLSVYRSGLLLHASAGADQARAEISTIGLGSILGILLLILWAFRSVVPILHVMIPVATGALVAMAATLLLFGRIHMITIAFGAGLVGVAVDYAMHFLCETRVVPRQQVIRRLLPGLVLGLMSSVLAYAGLALAPFPGLRQMAIFSAVGLVAAWLTVLLWLPLLSTRRSTGPLPAAATLDRWRKQYPYITQSPRLALVLIVLGVCSAGVVFQGSARDQVALLQTSSADLLAEDRQVQSLLGNGSSTAFLLVSGDSFEQVLQAEEGLQAALGSLIADNQLQGYRALSQVLPSLQRQEQNSQQVRSLYDAQWQSMADLLNLSQQQRSAALESMHESTRVRLTPQAWQALTLGQTWTANIVSSESGDVATVIQLQGQLSRELKQQLMALAEPLPNVAFVDSLGSMTELLERYRTEISNWLLLAYACVLVLLVLRYRFASWRILLPPLLASLISFAAFLLLHDGYNLFNLIALMLVLGIGLDMGIFLNETRESAHTWLAVTLSSASSLLAFGLLALSQTPVLYHFGVIVLPGLLLTWLLAPLMREFSTGETDHG
ncbi:MMPL family transporter [Marinobacterium stanieri]|uniref:MMPL family transporter n=1 Tax=Marinobacterium stanieri TaxID=49186 RepID=UPI00025583FB|nr:MMPL family transporter [Marinobacterium stanieri]